MKTIVTVMFILCGVLYSTAQISTRFFEKNKLFENNSRFKKSLENEFEKEMPTFDVIKMLQEDETVKNMDVPYRFGKSFEVNLTLQDGKWEKTDSTEVWSLKITSKGAYSLNFIFSTLYLPKMGELYIFNEDGSMLYGPLTEKQNQHGGKFLTDIIQGASAIICIIIPSKSTERPELTIQNVIHGYKKIYDNMDGGYGSSGSCNNDVACHTDWSTEFDGVVQILLSDGTELCSGSMLNNTNQDYRPFILTAFHCIDIGNPTEFGDQDERNGELEQYEINEAQEWLVRFRFRHKYCTNSTYIFDDVITYDDTQFRAAWNGSDFALMELQDCIAGDTYNRVTWLGWDRSNSTPASGAGIHHPSGDVMKISFYNTSPTIDGNFFNFQFNDGVVERGSSGSPIFNSNKQVVGQLLGTPSADPISCSNQDGIARYGRFFSSWTGDSTATTCLRNWLDPGNTGAMTLNTIRGPIISGVNLVCTSGTSFTILPAGRTVSWSCTSTNNNLAINSVTGYAYATSNTPGAGTISASINTGCGNVVLPAKTVWVGRPTNNNISLGVFFSNPPYDQVPRNQTKTIGILSNPDATAQGVTGYEWQFMSWASYITGYQTYQGKTKGTATILLNSSSPSQQIVTVSAKNACGCDLDLGAGKMFYAVSGFYLMISPNPSSGEVTVERALASNEKNLQDTEWDLEVYDSMQALKTKIQRIKGDKHTINTSSWKEGVYVVRAKIGTELISEKLVVKH